MKLFAKSALIMGVSAVLIKCEISCQNSILSAEVYINYFLTKVKSDREHMRKNLISRML